MSEKIAVEFEGVGKMYRLYRSRKDSFLDITSLGRIAPWWKPKIDDFWALRNVSFRLKAGSRLGIIGRNGAGKTTLLKLMTGNISPTEGNIRVQGEVQALLEAGAGFHPEFSGYENIEASLIQNGLKRSQIQAAVGEIAEFTELGDFLHQPFKTYSAGMQARLVFTTATMIRPEILIIDEILGAGDAYFAVKSRSRMKQLVDSGASILLVAHAMDQILLFCEEAIWLERGHIVMRGPSLEVVKAYEEFIHTLQDRQLRAANSQRKAGFRDAIEIGRFADTFVVALSFTGSADARADIAAVELRSDVIEEMVRVGDAQDSEATHFAYVALGRGSWSEPNLEASSPFRSLSSDAGGGAPALGELVFRSHGLNVEKQYSLRIRYRISGNGRLAVSASRNGELLVDDQVLEDAATWSEHDVALMWASEPGLPATELGSSRLDTEDTFQGTSLNSKSRDVDRRNVPTERSRTGDQVCDDRDESKKEQTRMAAIEGAVRRWPGEGSLLIDDVVLLDADRKERAVYQVGSPLTLVLHYRATKAGSFPIIYAVAIYRVDGIKVTQHVSSGETVHMEDGEHRSVELQFASMDLANGRYMISVSVHRDLDPQFPNETVRYDLLSYSYQFEIIGNPPLRTSLFVLPAHWKL